MLRTCRACQTEKPLTDYTLNPTSRGGRRWLCKPCCCKIRRLRRYGLTPERYQALFDSQGGRCAVCEADSSGGRGTWHIDHDHSCCPGQSSCGGCVRGILCAACNVGLGSFRDSTQTMQAAIDYLNRGLSL